MNKIILLAVIGILAVLLAAVCTAGAAAEFKSSSNQGKGQLSFLDLDGGGGEIVCGEATESVSPTTWINNSGKLQVKIEGPNGCRVAAKAFEEEVKATLNCQVEIKEPGEQMKMVEGTIVKSCTAKEGICEIAIEASTANSELAFNGEQNENTQVESTTLTGVTKTAGICPLESSKQEKIETTLVLDDVQPAPTRPNFTMFRAGGAERMSRTSEVRKMIVGNIGARGRFNMLVANQSVGGNWAKIANKTVQECVNIGEYENGTACDMEVKPIMIPGNRQAPVRLVFEVLSAGNIMSRAAVAIY